MTSIFILYTGGTVGMTPKDASGAGIPLIPQSLSELLKYVPGLEREELKLTYATLEPPLDSSNIGLEQWKEMAMIIKAQYDRHDGFVILHGTDTMAYSASALSFMFENLAKPVVFTGSQLPIPDPRTDARQNFVNAVQIAGYKAANLVCIPEVVVVFGDKILRGCRTRKISNSAWNAFDSPNYLPLGYIGKDIRINTKLLRNAPGHGKKFRVNTSFSEDVMDIALFPGLKAGHLKAMLEVPGIRGIVLRTFGAGNVPDRKDFLDVINGAINSRNGRKVILNITQCQEGIVEAGLYASGSALLELGVISGLDMTPEAALTKLMWTIGTMSGVRIKEQLQSNERGEQTERP